jgi:hypothetical protein
MTLPADKQVTAKDLACIETQLGRTPRDVHAIAYRCPCGNVAVVEPWRTISYLLLRHLSSFNCCDLNPRINGTHGNNE